jgi:PAS domain S-box-containing protein
VHRIKPSNARVAAILDETQHAAFVRTDGLFVRLMVVQWMAGILAAGWISPQTWAGATSSVHVHVWAAVLLGGLLTWFPVAVAVRHPGTALSRHTIAIGQMLTSALLIHLTGGRIETHFHVFGSLAFLAFYRDWKVLMTGSVVVAVDHVVRGVFWPQSVFGVLVSSNWRWLEHAGWVVFEDVFLLVSCRDGRREMRQAADRQAQLESVNESIELVVQERTAELAASNRRLADEALQRERVQLDLARSEARTRAIVDLAAEGIVTSDVHGKVQTFNGAAEEIFGYAASEVCDLDISLLFHDPEPEQHEGDLHRRLLGDGAGTLGTRREILGRRKNGESFPVDLSVREVVVNGERFFTGIVRDITERRRTQEELELRARQQAVVARIGREALGGASLEFVLDDSVRSVMDTLEADLCAVLELDADRGTLSLRAGLGWGEGLVGHATLDAATLVQERSEPGGDPEDPGGTRIAQVALFREQAVVSGISVPIPGSQRPFGALAACARVQRSW